MHSTNSQQHRGRFALATTLFATALASAASAAPIQVTIEPDAFANEQVLNTVSPYVTLSTATPPANNPTFNVVASTDADGASTGTKVFAHAGGISFWATIRKFRMDFHVPVSSVSLDYIASGFLGDSYTGRLEAYSAANLVIASYDTAALADGQHETMTVTAPQIAYAIAYPPTDPFGDLDHLQFTVVPEPATVALLAAALLFPCFAYRRLKSR